MSGGCRFHTSPCWLCTVTYTLRLMDMKAGEYTFTVPKHLDKNGNQVHETEVTKDVLSLQGYTGTPGYLAFQEWETYEQARAEPENKETVPMEDRLDYLPYGCDYQEELDKVDEICEKYGLYKLGIAWLEEKPELTWNALGIEGVLLPGAPAEVRYDQGYYYWDGTFYMPFCVTLTDTNASWRHPAFAEIRYAKKTAFSTFGIQVDLEEIEKTRNPKSLMYSRSPEEFYYCVMDFDGDDIDDFLWGSGNDSFPRW